MNVTDELLSRYTDHGVIKKKIKIYATDKMEIQGELILENKSYDERVSDCLNDSRLFIPVVNAKMYVNSKLVVEHDFVCINKQVIAYVIEE